MSKRSRARNKKLRNKRNKQKTSGTNVAGQKDAPLRQSGAKKLSRRCIERLCDASELIDAGRFDEAEEILTTEDRRRHGHPEVLHILLYLYQAQSNHHSLAMTAERLVRVRPRDADAWLMKAQGYLYCMRTPMALSAYRHFLEMWPTHEYAPKAKAAIETLEPQIESMLCTFGLTSDEFDLLVMHDEIIFELSSGDFEDAVAKARELLATKPNMVSARNNMTIALFQMGKMAEAVAASRETLGRYPDNRFAEATLGRFLFLNGHHDEAATIADKVMAHPADQQDAIAQQVEFVSLLGRDDDVLLLVQHADEILDKDPQCCALLSHHKAVAIARKGNDAEARRCWRKSLQLDPQFHPAKENLQHFESGSGHAPWPETFGKWIPPRVFEEFAAFAKGLTDVEKAPASQALRKFPHIRSLVPALLDRGDETGRKLAFGLAAVVRSPDLLDALQAFASSNRGPDDLRLEALSVLRNEGRLTPGLQRFYSRGKWTDIELFCPQITDKPVPPKNPAVLKLHEEGYHAMRDAHGLLAEQVFRRAVALDPDNPTSLHNLAGALLLIDDEESRAEAETILSDIFERFPDYLFARTTLAQIAVRKGEFEKAGDLIAPLRSREKMHRSEAMAYLTVTAHLALANQSFAGAETTICIMEDLDPTHPNIGPLRSQIELARRMESELSGPHTLNRLGKPVNSFQPW